MFLYIPPAKSIIGYSLDNYPYFLNIYIKKHDVVYIAFCCRYSISRQLSGDNLTTHSAAD